MSFSHAYIRCFRPRQVDSQAVSKTAWRGLIEEASRRNTGSGSGSRSDGMIEEASRRHPPEDDDGEAAHRATESRSRSAGSAVPSIGIDDKAEDRWAHRPSTLEPLTWDRADGPVPCVDQDQDLDPGSAGVYAPPRCKTELSLPPTSGSGGERPMRPVVPATSGGGAPVTSRPWMASSR